MTPDNTLQDAALRCEKHIGLCLLALNRRMMNSSGAYTEPSDLKQRLSTAIDELNKALVAIKDAPCDDGPIDRPAVLELVAERPAAPTKRCTMDYYCD